MEDNKYMIEFTCKDPETSNIFQNMNGSLKVFEEPVYALDKQDAISLLHELVPDVIEIISVRLKNDRNR